MDPEEWYNRAEKDIKAAEGSINSEEYNWACFQVHQAVEKALKALYIKKHKKLIKVHDLSLLAKRCNAPKNIFDLCSDINPVYVDTRYPDVPKDYKKEEALILIDKAKEVIEWIEKIL